MDEAIGGSRGISPPNFDRRALEYEIVIEYLCFSVKSIMNSPFSKRGGIIGIFALLRTAID